MKHTKRIKGFLLLVSLLLTVSVQGQMDRQEEKPMMTERKQAMMDGCRQMQQHMQQMQDRMRQMDKELAQRLDALEKAEGEEKVQALEQTVQTLGQQHLQISEQRQNMMQRMMQHMGRHMTGDSDERGGIMNCPMMDDQYDEDDSQAPDEMGHDAHP